MGNKFVFLCVLFFALVASPGKANSNFHLGVGFSTVTSGRQIPSLELGIAFENGWAVSGMLAGARTKVYYTSGGMLNVMRIKDLGDFWFGRLEAGIGGGAYHGEKGTYTSIDSEGKPTDLKKDQDNVVGPAFRVAFYPFTHMHVSFEFLMGISGSNISNAWQDVGLCAIGIDL